MKTISFLPPQASTVAQGIDQFYFYLIAVSLFFAFLIFTLVIFFSFKYRRKSSDDAPKEVHGNTILELVWTFIPLALVMSMFVGATHLYFKNMRPPADAMEIYVVGKQWMWKFQHPEGRREINSLHVPMGQSIKLNMTSEDVIHSLFIPAFRVKMDVLPGRYTHLWFNATKPGVYHLFCTEYCGTNHSGMVGSVVVLEPSRYEEWLNGTLEGGGAQSMAASGETLFQRFNCNSCHADLTRGPKLIGLYGRKVELENGSSVTADDAYLRESILTPTAKVVKGYLPLMPTYSSQMSEEQVMQLIAYLKSLGADQTTGGISSAPGVVAAPNAAERGQV